MSITSLYYFNHWSRSSVTAFKMYDFEEFYNQERLRFLFLPVLKVLLNNNNKGIITLQEFFFYAQP